MRRGHESEITMSPWLHGIWIREKNSQLDLLIAIDFNNVQVYSFM